MKHIRKQNEPIGLTKVRKQHLSWEDFHKQYDTLYYECRNQAIHEQGEECAYTGLPLNDASVIHLDHFKKRENYESLTFDWNNLFAAIKDSCFGADFKDHVINKQNHDAKYKQLLNPAIDNPESLFWYSTDGSIVARSTLSDDEKQKVETTIETFNLNHSKLIHRRRELLKMLENYKQLPETATADAVKLYGFSFVVSFFYQHLIW